MEEGQQILQNLDSLWFFTSVFSNRTPPPPPPAVENDAVEPPGEEIATPISQNEQNFELGEEQRIEEMKTEEKRRKCSRRRKIVVGEMDLRYAVKEICECSNWLMFDQEIRSIGNGNENFCYYQRQRKKKMPAFGDSLAMKQHIRSWAYAVACTVR